MPPRLGTKIIPIGANREAFCASCPAPLGRSMVARPAACAASRMACWKTGSVRAGWSAASGTHSISTFSSRAIAAKRSRIPRPDPFDFCALEVAQFDRKFHAPWNDVARSGFDPHITHRANLPAGLRPNFFAHSKDSPRCGSECVLPAIHRRRASMVGESRGHASPPIDPDDALHDPDGNAGLVEHGALLDMKLQITGHRPRPDASFGKPRWVLAVAAQPVGQGNSLFVPSLENSGAEHPGRGARTEQALAEVVTLLVAPDDHFEWMPRRHLVLVKGTHYFQRAQAAHIAVEIAAMQHGIDVRPEKQHRQVFGARAPAEDVAGGVHAHGKPRLSHQPHHVFARGHVGLREAQARDATLGVAAELTELVQCLLEALRVDLKAAQRALRLLLALS